MLNDNVKYNNNKIIKYRDFSKSNVQKFSASLRSINWDFVESANNTQHSYELFHETFFAFYNLYFPLLFKSCNKNNHGFHPWMTKGLLISRSKKLSLCKFSLKIPLMHLLLAIKNIVIYMLKLSLQVKNFISNSNCLNINQTVKKRGKFFERP